MLIRKLYSRIENTSCVIVIPCESLYGKALVMANSEQMPKVDLAKDKPILNVATEDWMRIVEKKNLERVTKLKTLRRKNFITAGILGAAIFSIYSYTILSVKQETFLDDFEEPKLVPPSKDQFVKQ